MNQALGPTDDLAAVRAALGHANPEPDPTLPREEVLAARARMGMARVAPPAPRHRGRLVAAGAVAALSVATLVAVVVVSPRQGTRAVELATGPSAKAVNATSAATQAAGTARGLLTVAHGGRTVSATGVGDFDNGDASADIALGDEGTSPAGTVTVRRTSAGVYVRLPQGLSPLSTVKPWLRIDAADLARLTQLALGDIGAQITGAPLDALAYLRAVSGELVDEGPDLTRGEPTTRYRTMIDPRKVVGQLPQVLQNPAAGAGVGAQSLPASVWIDAQGRLRKLEVSADGPDSVGGPAITAALPGDDRSTVTLELFDFGVAVQVEAPPAEEVTDVGGLLGTFLSNAASP